MITSTELTYVTIHFWFVCYRLRITKMSLKVDKTDSIDSWQLTPKK